MAILTMRMAAAIIAQPRDGWTFEALLPILGHINEPYDQRTVATMVGREFTQKGWTKRVGKIGPKNTYAAQKKIFTDNAFQMDLMIDMLPEDMRFETRQRWIEITKDETIESEPAAEQTSPPVEKRSFKDMTGKERMAYIKKDSYKLYKIGNGSLTKAQIVRGLIASESDTFSTTSLRDRLKQTLPDVDWKESTTQAPMTNFRKRGHVIQVGQMNRRPIMRHTPEFFKYYQNERDKYLAAFPEREDIINDNFYRAFNPDREEQDDVSAADVPPASADDVAGDPDVDKRTRDDQDTQPSSTDSHDATMDQSDLQSTGSLGTPPSSAADLPSDISLPASYVVGKCIIDYLSMVSVDPLPNLLQPIQSALKSPESDPDMQGKDTTTITAEQKHEIKHMLKTKDDQASELNRRILELTNHNQSLHNQNKRINDRLEQALRENAHLKSVNSQQMVQLEKLGQRQRQGKTGGKFTLAECATIDGSSTGAVRLRKHG